MVLAHAQAQSHVEIGVDADDVEDHQGEGPLGPFTESPFERMPPEILLHIADACTWGEESTSWEYPANYARHHAKLARVNSRLNRLLEPDLYRRNERQDDTVQSCVRWAAENGSLGTIIKANRYGLPLDQQNSSDNGSMEVSPLHCAIYNGHSNVVEFLLVHGANVHAPSSPTLCVDCDVTNKLACHMTLNRLEPVYPLHTAISHGRPEDVRRLVERGAYLVAENVSAIFALLRGGHSSLIRKHLLDRTDPISQGAQLLFASAISDLALLTHLLKRPGANLARASNAMQESALHVATCGPGDATAVVEYLCQHPSIDVNATDRYGYTAFLNAVQHGKVSTTQLMLHHPAIDGRDMTPDRENGLHLAAMNSDLAMVKLLLERSGADIKAVDLYGRSVLRLACSRPETDGTIEVVTYLLSVGAPMWYEGEGKPGDALVHSLCIRNMRTAHVLLQAGMETTAQILNHTIPEGGQGLTILQLLLLNPRPHQAEILRRLIGFGIDVNKVGLGFDTPDKTAWVRFGESPLLYAAVGARSTECMRLLIDAGAKATTNGYSSVLWNFCFISWRNKVINHDVAMLNAERLIMLMQTGLPVGHVRPGTSALSYACNAAIKGTRTLLELILKAAERETITEDHMCDLIKRYSKWRGANVARAHQVASLLRAAHVRMFGPLRYSRVGALETLPEATMEG